MMIFLHHTILLIIHFIRQFFFRWQALSVDIKDAFLIFNFFHSVRTFFQFAKDKLQRKGKKKSPQSRKISFSVSFFPLIQKWRGGIREFYIRIGQKIGSSFYRFFEMYRKKSGAPVYFSKAKKNAYFFVDIDKLLEDVNYQKTIKPLKKESEERLKSEESRASEFFMHQSFDVIKADDVENTLPQRQSEASFQATLTHIYQSLARRQKSSIIL